MKYLEQLQQSILPYKTELYSHPIYESIQDLESLQLFMSQHIFSVWDFMSLTKFLQNELAPTTVPWFPPRNTNLANFINQVMVAEESDIHPTCGHKSHFELYIEAMEEINAPTSDIRNFIESAMANGVDATLDRNLIATHITTFIHHTFSCLNKNAPHIAASAFAYGREHIIPQMFQKIVDTLEIKEPFAPSFIYYLKRHIEVDGDEHGPMSELMMLELCGDDQQKWLDATEVAIQSIKARIAFWDGILATIQANRFSKSEK